MEILKFIEQLGAPAVFVIILLKMILDFYGSFQRKKEQQNTEKSNCKLNEELINTFWEIKKTTDKLYEMHNKYDEDGLPIWYVKRSSSEEMNKILKELSDIMKENLLIMRQVYKKLDK